LTFSATLEISEALRRNPLMALVLWSVAMPFILLRDVVDFSLALRV
jgi:hypothetical protein